MDSNTLWNESQDKISKNAKNFPQALETPPEGECLGPADSDGGPGYMVRKQSLRAG
jgi:hypothetical protein